VLRSVRALVPDEDVVYLADQANVPYGGRDDADLARLAAANVAVLEAAHVDAIVMGCNTSCAVAAKRGWPLARVPIFDLIAAAADDVVARGLSRIGIVATVATAASGAYGDAIRARRPGAVVQEIGAPALVPLVEAGMIGGAIARAAVAEAVAPLSGSLDALVLACTHYPLLAEHFAAALPGVPLIDPAVAQAARAAAFVAERGGPRGRGHTRFLTTGPIEPYRHALGEVFDMLRPGDEVARIEHALTR
jgi:glutamate racemase